MTYRPHPAAQAAAEQRPAPGINVCRSNVCGYCELPGHGSSQCPEAARDTAARAARAAAEQDPQQSATCGRALATGQPCPDHPANETSLAVLDGRDASAFVIIRPADDERVSVEAGAPGMSKAAAAYALREAADAFDILARAEGDEPIPYTLTEQAEAAVEDQPARPRVLTDDEYEAAYRAARRAAPYAGRITVADALTAALASLGILTAAPEPDPETCPAQFADLDGEWHQCAEDRDHDQATGHSDGEWSWPHGDTHARPEPDEDEDEDEQQ